MVSLPLDPFHTAQATASRQARMVRTANWPVFNWRLAGALGLTLGFWVSAIWLARVAIHRL
jgi:hypothetical protein